MQYRRDIDGLRAIAILPVVLYHVGFNYFSGGFVGVDVFFVISGYLITSLIAKETDSGSFSLKDFYERRARRILPALFSVAFFASILAFFFLLPFDHNDFSQSLMATIGFASNFHFLGDTGYFDGPAEFKPLLHTWSLALEEQFYIFFPLLFVFISRRLMFWRNKIILALFVSSLAISVWGVEYAPKATFYLLHTRAWELLLGSMLALNIVRDIQNSSLKNVLSFAGLGLIFFSVLMFDTHTAFPGASAFLPCFGAFLVIWSNKNGTTLCGKLLSLSPVVFIGLISYSLYLWHWVVIVFAKQILDRPLGLQEMSLSIIISLALSVFSWWYIERPVRKKMVFVTRKKLTYALGGAFVFLFGLGLSGDITNGFPKRISEEARAYMDGAKDFNPDYEKCDHISPENILARKLCPLGAKDVQNPDFIMWGDSHADAIMPGIKKMAEKYKLKGWFASYNTCAPLLGITRPLAAKSERCKEFNDAIFQVIKEKKIKHVLIAARWAGYAIGTQADGLDPDAVMLISFDRDNKAVTLEESKQTFSEGLKRTVQYFKESGVNLWIVEQAPIYKKIIPRALARASLSGRDPSEIQQDYSVYTQRNSYMQQAFDGAVKQGAHLVKLTDKLCTDKTTCLVSDQGRSLYRDDDHLSAFGAVWISDVFDPFFKKIEETPVK